MPLEGVCFLVSVFGVLEQCSNSGQISGVLMGMTRGLRFGSLFEVAIYFGNYGGVWL